MTFAVCSLYHFTPTHSDRNMCTVFNKTHLQVWAEGKTFTSFRKVALDEKIEGAVVFSMHSISKGFLGECGHRRAPCTLQPVELAQGLASQV
jgi:hypothetical protein